MKVCLQVYGDVNKKAYFVDIWFLLFLEKGIVSGGNYKIESIGSDRMNCLYRIDFIHISLLAALSASSTYLKIRLVAFSLPPCYMAN